MTKIKPVIRINPPPKDRRCECCGKAISELKPFGKEGDPLNGNFDGSLLVKTFRSMAPEIKDEEFLKFQEDHEKYEDFYQEVIDRFGKDEAERLFAQDQLSSTVGASWECRDCIVLSSEKYFKVMDGKQY